MQGQLTLEIRKTNTKETQQSFNKTVKQGIKIFEKKILEQNIQLMKHDFHQNNSQNLFKTVRELQQVPKYQRLILVFIKNRAPRENFNCYFSGLFCQYWRQFYSGGGAGHQAIILWRLDTFLIFPNFLRSQVLSRSATRRYHVYK